MPLREWALGALEPAQSGGWPPARDRLVPIDVMERAGEVEIRASVPGFAPEEIEVTVQGDVLTLQGRHAEETERSEGTYHVRERRSGSFQRVVQLPVPVSAEGAAAKISNGELQLVLPKRPEAMTKRIDVTAVTPQPQA
jgi:HSP20 family protein